MLIVLPRPCIWECAVDESSQLLISRTKISKATYFMNASALYLRADASEPSRRSRSRVKVFTIELEAAFDKVDGGQRLASKSGASMQAVSLANHVFCKS